MSEISVLQNSQSAISAERLLTRVQAVTGSLFAIFVFLHLSNVAMAPFGVEIFNDYQSLIRRFYQYPLVELAVVILPLLLHALAGIGLYFIRRRRKRRPGLMKRLHTWTGVFLLLFIFGHILATRGASYFYDVRVEFEGLAFSLWFFPAYFYPYYFLLALAGFYHVTMGLRTLLNRFGITWSRRNHLIATFAAAAWITISLMSLGGLLFNIEGLADSDYARLAAQLTGLDPTEPWK